MLHSRRSKGSIELPLGSFQVPCPPSLPVRRSSQTPSSPKPHLGRKFKNNIDNLDHEMTLMQIQASRQSAPQRCALTSPVFPHGQGFTMRHPSPYRFTFTRFPSRSTPFTEQQRVPLCRRNEHSALNSWQTRCSAISDQSFDFSSLKECERLCKLVSKLGFGPAPSPRLIFVGENSVHANSSRLFMHRRKPQRIMFMVSTVVVSSCRLAFPRGNSHCRFVDRVSR